MAKDVIHITAIISVNSRKLFRENKAGFMGNRMARNLSAAIVTIINIETYDGCIPNDVYRFAKETAEYSINQPEAIIVRVIYLQWYR